MKKMFLALALVALVMVLTSMQGAKASDNYRQCPNCSEYELESSWYDDNQHHVYCSGCGYDTYEDHFGGTALCYDNAICEGCNSRYGEWAPHNWATTMSHDETYDYFACTNEGCTWRNEIRLHDWGNWTKVDDQNHKRTCRRSGCGAETTVEHVWNGSHWCGYPRKCKDCGEYYGEVLDHEYWYEYKTDEQHKINCYHCDGLFGREDHSGGTATCIAKAVCEKCKAEYGEYAAHKGGTATCTEKAVCEICGQEYGAPLDHDWATAWTQGDTTHYYACSRCTERKDEAPHSYSWTYVDDNTCKGECTCGATTTEAHYDRWASFCDYQPHCEKCGHDYGSRNEHSMYYVDKGESGHKPSCYNCDTYFFLEAHSGGTATCTALAKCDKCGAEYGGYGEHTGGKATCTEKAKCTVCGQPYGDVDPNNHDLIHHEAKTPTCTESGWDAYGTCSRCDYSTYVEKPALKHDLINHEAKAPTCTEIGWDAYQTCSRCDYTTYTEKKALGHDLIDHEAQAPTCTAIGWDAYQTCSRCDYTTYVEKKALGHDLIDHAAQAPTCTEIGRDAYQTCSRCDYTTYVEKKALGHDLIDHEAQAPTCTEIGWDAYQTCSRCDYTTYVEKKALGHTEVIDPAVPATYTSTGLTEGKHCSVCNQVLEAQEVVPRLVAPAPVEWAHVHTPVTDAAVAATCTRSGLTAGSHCGMCGEVLTKQRRTSALGHDFGAWTPAMAGTHSAICRRCGESSAVGCTLVELDGARACPVCGYAEGEARTTVIAPASAAGDVPGGSLVIVKAETEKGKWLLMGFERGGRLLNIRGQIRFSVPAEALAGAALPGMEISGGQAVFALTMDREMEVILVEMGQ